MTRLLSNRLKRARHAQFFGREPELALFARMLADHSCPYCILFVFGPSGVGKTTLLHEFAYQCDNASVVSVVVDGRSIDPTPDGFETALAQVLDTARDELIPALERAPHTLIIDGWERLRSISGWIRQSFFPRLPERSTIVLASHEPPEVEWRTEPGWRTLVRVCSLRNFSSSEGAEFLERQGVPEAVRPQLLSVSHGHPLALTIAAETYAQSDSIRIDELTTDILRTLLSKFIKYVPDQRHRGVLEAASLVNVLTEPLLSEMLGEPATELFEWLRELSFMAVLDRGVQPHDLTREMLSNELRWRDRPQYQLLHDRAREFYLSRLQSTAGSEQQAVLFDYIYLHRDNPVVRPVFDWQSSGQLVISRPAEADTPELLALVERHEGSASRELAAFWLARPEPEVLAFREANDAEICGFMMALPLHLVGPSGGDDPAVAAAWRFLSSSQPLREGELCTMYRFWISRADYQSVSPVQSSAFLQMARHYLTTPGLAFSFVPYADPDFWAPVLAYADMFRIPEAEFTVGERRYGVYGHDWRSVPPIAWLKLLAEREVQQTPTEPQAHRPDSALVVLSESDFVDAVRDALRQLIRPTELKNSPLLRSRLVMDEVDDGASVSDKCAALQTIIRETVEAMNSDPKWEKQARTIYRTYINPAANQEQAAHLLGFPFSTYRRHLTRGVAELSNLLWQQELNV